MFTQYIDEFVSESKKEQNNLRDSFQLNSHFSKVFLLFQGQC